MNFVESKLWERTYYLEQIWVWQHRMPERFVQDFLLPHSLIQDDLKLVAELIDLAPVFAAMEERGVSWRNILDPTPWWEYTRSACSIGTLLEYKERECIFEASLLRTLGRLVNETAAPTQSIGTVGRVIPVPIIMYYYYRDK